MDIWRNIGGSSLAPLLANSRYPEKPSTSNMVPGLVSPSNIGDNYGLRLKTFYVVSYYLTLLNFLPILLYKESHLNVSRINIFKQTCNDITSNKVPKYLMINF